MITGMMIDELINAVERVERQARTEVPPALVRPARKEAYPAFTYMYDFSTMQQMVVGVA